MKRIRKQRVSAHLLIYQLLFFMLLLGFGLDLEYGLGVTLEFRVGVMVQVCVRFKVGIEAKVVIFLILHNVTLTAASANNYSIVAACVCIIFDVY